MSAAIASANEAIDPMGDKDPDLRKTLEDLRDSALEVWASPVLDFRESNRALLVFNARLHFGAYTRLGIQRAIASVEKHAYVVVGPVLAAGIDYTWVVRATQTALVNWLRFGILGALALAVAFGIFREYVVSRWLKTLRRRVERRLLLPVVHQLLQANLQGLLSEMIDRNQSVQRSNSRSNALEETEHRPKQIRTIDSP